LGDKKFNVRKAAAWALGKLGAKEYAQDIAKLLSDKDSYVRGNGISALGYHDRLIYFRCS